MKKKNSNPMKALNMPFKHYDTTVKTTIYDVVYKDEIYSAEIHHEPGQNTIEILKGKQLLYWESTEHEIYLTIVKKYIIYTIRDENDLNDITEEELNSIDIIRQSYEVTSTIKGKQTYYVSYTEKREKMTVELCSDKGELMYRREYDGTINKSQAKQEVIKYLKHEKRDAKAS